MATEGDSARDQVYKRLKKGFRQFLDMMTFHLDDSLLHEMGVDPILIDIEEETRTGGPYFLPMSQARLDSLERPSEESRIHFDDEFSDPDGDWSDAYYSCNSIESQLPYTETDINRRAIYQGTQWYPRRYVSASSCFPLPTSI